MRRRSPSRSAGAMLHPTRTSSASSPADSRVSSQRVEGSMQKRYYTHRVLSQLVVRLLGPAGTLAQGAERAIATGLGALYLDGLPPDALPGAGRQALQRAAARTASDLVLQVRELTSVLGRLDEVG